MLIRIIKPKIRRRLGFFGGEGPPRYSYLMLHGLLAAEGWVVNKRRNYRLYCEAGL